MQINQRNMQILDALSLCRGGSNRMRLMKALFLLKHEGPFVEISGYDFVPYKYGPYSFAMHHDVHRLIAAGLVEAPTGKTWRLTDAGAKYVALHSTLSEASRRFILKLNSVPINKILSYVYDKYPWYTINADDHRKRQMARPYATKTIFTIGYEGRTVDSFFDIILRAGITTLADVRKNPTARRYGFHKSSLSAICSNLNLRYLHFPELGIHSDLRRNLTTPAQFNALFDKYESTVAMQHELLLPFQELLKKGSVALLCREAGAHDCHRSRLASLLEQSLAMPVVHL